MKNFTWDIPFLLKKRKELLNLIYSEKTTTKERNKLDLDIEYIENMLYDISLTKYIPYFPYLLKSQKEIEEQIKYIFNELLSQFQIQTIKDTSNYFLDNESEDINKDVLKRKIPLENQIELIKKNFGFNNTLSKNNDELFNPDNRRLHIHKSAHKNIFYNINNTGYILNRNKEELDDFTSLCHELGHNHEFILTNGRLDIKYYIQEENHFLLYQEIYSIFYELLSAYILQKEKIITEEERFAFNNNVYKINTKSIDKFISAYLISKESDMSSEELISLKKMKVTLQDISVYYYAYLIAVNLFEQYLIDEEKSLYNLNYLVNNITPDNEDTILKFIDANPNDLTKIIKHTKPFIKKKNN